MAASPTQWADLENVGQGRQGHAVRGGARREPGRGDPVRSRCPDWVDEYDLASALLGDAIEMVKCETNDLLVPADSEILIEGVLSHNEVEPEGPFGEYPGYVSERVMSVPRQTVTCVTFRNEPDPANLASRRAHG